MHIKQNHRIPHDADRDREVCDHQRQPVAEIGNEATRLTEGVGGVTAKAPGLAAEHPALGKNIGNRCGPRDGDDPGENR